MSEDDVFLLNNLHVHIKNISPEVKLLKIYIISRGKNSFQILIMIRIFTYDLICII